MLYGPEASSELREDMMLAISSLSVVCRNIVLPFSFARWSGRCLCEYLMLFFVVSTIEAK